MINIERRCSVSFDNYTRNKASSSYRFIINLTAPEAITFRIIKMDRLFFFGYDCYLTHNEERGGGGKQTKRKKKTENKPLDENKKIKIETGMQFYAALKQQ